MLHNIPGTYDNASFSKSGRKILLIRELGSLVIMMAANRDVQVVTALTRWDFWIVETQNVPQR